MKRIDFFHEVKICGQSHKHSGEKGVVLGISEEDGKVFGYAVLIHGMNTTTYFEVSEIETTGVVFPREDFY